jgi:alkanesulfonate monooxygenase SsuD/methylene tetrahydromethanopterin reductase-like flavin-dependent oxidoreductase (luciferase family)
MMTEIEVSYDRATNPVFGPQPFKLGLFGYLHDSGNALSVAPGRWRARWDDIAAMARMADAAGFDFLLPIARWREVRGAVKHRLWNYETLTAAAALSGITERIGVFATVHVPLVHPVIAAKMLTTIDHASHGRAGLNIVCGWNQEDFDMFGMKVIEHDDRYQQGEEWFDLLKHILAGDDEPIDYDTRYYPGLKGVVGQPGSIQQPYPATFSASYSPRGRDFAIKNSDFLLLGHVPDGENTAEIDDINARSAAAGRAVPPGVLCTLAPFIRETRAEAEAHFRHFAIDNADPVAIGEYRRLRTPNADSSGIDTDRGALAMASGGFPVVGTPEDLVDTLLRVRRLGYAGATLTPPHFIDDLHIIIEKALPLMEQAGLRLPTTVNEPA